MQFWFWEMQESVDGFILMNICNVYNSVLRIASSEGVLLLAFRPLNVFQNFYPSKWSCSLCMNLLVANTKIENDIKTHIILMSTQS